MSGWILNPVFRENMKTALLGGEEGEALPSITQEGFQFLLMDTASQVWYFLLQYLDTVQSRGLDLVSCLAFLFQLSFSTLGKDYSTEGMSESQLRFLQHLREFGLVYQRKTPVIPPTITDQVRLWELERARITFTDGVLYNQFLSQADFEMLRNYAKEMDVLVWELPEKRVMVVTKEGHDDVKRFWKRQRQT
nr:hypothetical protein BaRGS_034613 [Batillaria attramentaria]